MRRLASSRVSNSYSAFLIPTCSNSLILSCVLIDQMVSFDRSGRALIPTALSIDLRPISGSNSRDDLGFDRQGTRGAATRIEDSLAAGRDAVAEPGVMSLAKDRPSSAPARWAAAA